MKSIRMVPVAALLVLVALVCIPSFSFAGEVMVRKADNVFFCVDTSGSMMSDYRGGGKSDLASATELLQMMTKAMPDLGYQTGLYRFAPYQELRSLALHDQDDFMAKAGMIPRQVPIFGNRTPLGDGLYELAWPISAVPGPTAVILFTDGGQNEGEPPLPVAEQLYAGYDVCLHVVSFANTPEEQGVVDRLAALNPCSVKAIGEDLLKDPAMLEAFVRDVLWKMKPLPEPPAPPVAKRVFHTIRMDLNLEFDTNKSDIRPEFHDEIGKVGEIMNRYPETTAMVVGYADAVGSYVSNIHLSGDRAAAVRGYLSEGFGIASSRMQSVGYGENFPMGSNASDEGRQRNRRVTVFVTGWFVEE